MPLTINDDKIPIGYNLCFQYVLKELLKAKRSMSMAYPAMSGRLLFLTVNLKTCGNANAANLNKDVVTVFIDK